MSLGLIKPGMRSANLTGKRHPRTDKLLVPIGFLRDGTAVWPQIGAAPDEDDPDDPTFTGSGGGGESDDDDEEDDEPKKPKADDDEDDDEKEEKLTRPERQAARYRVKLREAEKRERDLAARLKALEDKDKKPDEVASRDLDEARTKLEQMTSKTRDMTLELAFFKSNTVDWVDPTDALKLVDLDDVDVDEDGTVDPVQLRKALRALAKAKPHLVKKTEPKGSAQDDDEDDENDEEPRSRQSASTMNRSRKGTKGKAPSREDLARKFPVLNRL